MVDDEVIYGFFRDFREFFFRFVKFYLRIKNKYYEVLKWFGKIDGIFLVVFRGDGCLFGKNKSVCFFLVSILNVGKRVVFSVDNFFIFGVNYELEFCVVV